MAELKFLKGSSASFSGLTKDSNYFYLVSNTDGTVDMYLGSILLTKGATVADVTDLKAAIDKLNGAETVEGSVKNTVATEIASIVAGAPENLDTLKEIADYISNDPYGTAALVNRVSANETAIQTAEGEIDTLQSEMDAVEALSHSHDNKSLLDSYTQLETDLADAVSKKHEHSNKEVLDGITSDKVTAWDAAESNAIADAASKYQPKGEYEELGAAAQALVDAKAYTDEKVSGISFDGYATEEWVEGKGYLTEHQSLENYATKSYADQAEADAIASAKEYADKLYTGSGNVTVSDTQVIGLVWGEF